MNYGGLNAGRIAQHLSQQLSLWSNILLFKMAYKQGERVNTK